MPTNKVTPAVVLEPGQAVRLSDDGEAVVTRVAGDTAYVRCGCLHRDPLPYPADSLTAVPAGDETELHQLFRREATTRGELETL